MPLTLGQTDMNTISSTAADRILIVPILNRLNMPPALLFTVSVFKLVTVDGGWFIYCFILMLKEGISLNSHEIEC